MSIASCSELERRQALWQEMRGDLVAAGVPVEAWPVRIPRIYEAYTVQSPAGVRIQALLRREAFLVPRPHDPPRRHSEIIDWEGNAAQAWEEAKRRARWR